MARDKNIASSTNVELEIVHAVRGRVRLRLKSGAAREILLRIADLLRQQGGIRTVQIKQTSNSLVVTFDPDAISIEQLTDSLQPFGLNPTSTKGIAQSKVESQAITYSKLFSLVPPLVGLGVARGLQVSGWKSILTYILAAGVTREVIDQVTGESEEVKLSPAKQASTSEIVAAEISTLLRAIETDYEIVHQTPGRIRLRVPRISRDYDARSTKGDRTYAQELKRLLEQDNRIIDVRLKINSGSVVILYSPEALSESNKEKVALNNSNENKTIQSGEDSESLTIPARKTTIESNLSDLSDAPPPHDETAFEPKSLTSETKTDLDIKDTLEAEAESTITIADDQSEIETDLEFTNGGTIAKAGYWSNFKSSMLLIMLQLMGDPQVQTAKT